MINTKVVGMLVAAFVAGSFVASPELRAYAANTVFSTDIVDGEVKTPDLANNAVTAAKIKDGEVKAPEIGMGAVNSAKIADNSITAADIATDAVGAAELQGVTKLMYGQCNFSSAETAFVYPAGGGGVKDCLIAGVDSDDSAVGMFNVASDCFDVHRSRPITGAVTLWFKNECSEPTNLGNGANAGIIVYDK